MRKFLFLFCAAVVAAGSMSLASVANNDVNAAEAVEAVSGVCTVIANPGENAATEVNINWHSPQGKGFDKLYYSPVDVPGTKPHKTKPQKAKASRELCTAFDSMYSKSPAGENIYEYPHFVRNTVSLKKLRPSTLYRYTIAGDTAVRYFRTAPESGPFRAAIISDFHSYSPLLGRQRAAMAMLDTLESINGAPFDLMIHLGDVCAWGGSYSFWKNLYEEPHFRHNTWAGLNGNHDNMDRTNKRNTNQFFRNTNAAPLNGYPGEEGVCYFFRYADVLFVVLNSESMRSDEGLARAQEWVQKVVKDNPAKWVVVMEHYQWFFAESGKDSQYPRWCEVFDSLGVDLALGANNHRYASTHPLSGGRVVAPGEGTIYIQTPSADNERGVDIDSLAYNADKIKKRWSEGAHTVGAMIMDVAEDEITLTLYDRQGRPIDVTTQKSHR